MVSHVLPAIAGVSSHLGRSDLARILDESYWLKANTKATFVAELVGRALGRMWLRHLLALHYLPEFLSKNGVNTSQAAAAGLPGLERVGSKWQKLEHTPSAWSL
jgi:hypothetical protein